HCEVAIVGGGIGGLYTAESLLRHEKETNVCLFERNERLGGRFYDYVFPQVPDETVGLGAWRIDLANYNLRNILERLSIKYEEWNFYENSRTETRGQSSREDHEIKKQSFPTLLKSKFQNMTWSEMHQYLFNEEHVREAGRFATFQTYQQNILTPEGSEFYFDIFGYEGDLRGGEKRVVEYYKLLDEDFTGNEIRPVKGMSAITNALEESAKALGAKIYTGSEISSINQRKNIFVLRTSTGKIKAKKLVVAAPPGSFKKIRGRVAQMIQQQEEFKSIKAFPAFKAAAVYERAWWEDIKDEATQLYPMERFLSNSDCLGWTLPHSGRGKNGEAVLHLAYKDGECGEKWGSILNSVSKSLVDQEVHRAIEYKFNMTVPKPLETVYKYWNEGAWYLQRPGCNVSMRRVENWAKKPFPRKQIYIVGSAYNPYRAYSEGALVSANNALLEGWGIPIPSPGIKTRVVEPLRKTGGTNLRMIR
ncbi:unnamed protein product, partial [Porites lobata]